MKQLEYTIVIPVYNKEGFMIRCISSALNQTLAPSSILIIDDASTDQSIKEITPFLIDKRIKLIQLKKNGGTSKLLNEALRYIKTPYFIQLDGDDWLEPNAAKELVSALHSNPSAGFAYGNHHFYYYDKKNELNNIKPMIAPNFENKYDLLLKLSFMINPRCYRTKSIIDMGGWIIDYPFDKWEGRFFEDVQMILRLANKYSWIHVNKFLHNITINMNTSQHDGKLSLINFNHLRMSMYEYMLEEWGGEYSPLWNIESGYILLKDLTFNKAK